MRNSQEGKMSDRKLIPSYDLTADEYLAAAGVSNTMLGKIDQSPAHLQSYLHEPHEVTRAMEIGTFFHELTLLDNAPKNIAIRPPGPEGDFRKSEGKAWRKAQEAEGKTILTQDEYDSIYGMRDSIMRNPKLRYAIETGAREFSLFAPFNLGGSVMRKGRIDLVTTAASLLDFKTTTDASLSAFSKTIANMGYHRQAAYYLDLAKENGLPHTEFVFVAVEKVKPYAVGIYYLDQESIGIGRKRYIELLQLFIECQSKNEWPAYSPEPQPISLPMWAMREQAA
jgi:hypothetical protein